MSNISINTSEYYFLEWPVWMEHLKSFGFENMEISINDFRDPEYIAAFKKLIHDNDIHVSSVHDWFHFFTPNDAAEIKSAQERLIQDINYTVELGADKLIWYTGGNLEYEGKAAVAELLKRLEPVLKHATEKKVTLLLETEFVKDGCDPAASVTLLKELFTTANSPFLACNFDASNLYIQGIEPFPYAYEELKPWIRYVHLKDARELVAGVHSADTAKGYLLEGFKQATCCPIGEGAVNFYGLLNALRADNYSGYLSLELHMKDEYQDETLVKTLEYLTQYNKQYME